MAGGPVTGVAMTVLGRCALAMRTGRRMRLRYRVRLVRADRWLVAAVNTTEGG